MRHGDKINNLGRKTAHRKALMSNLAIALITHKRISTTLAKGKALRTYIEPLLTKSKLDETHSRRTVFSHLQNKYAVHELFTEIAPKIESRKGGYTRILKTGFRYGDGAELCQIELVDFALKLSADSQDAASDETAKKGRTRRGKKGAKKTELTEANTDLEKAD